VILVFGGNGQLGRELSHAAALRGMPIETPSRNEVDIVDTAAVAEALSRIGPALVVNAAAYTKVDRAEANIEEARRANEIGPGVLARACADAHLPMVHVSTDYVFDGTKETAYREGDEICPIGVYGRTKAAGEAAVRNTLRRHIILRTAWIYSEFGHNFLKTIINLAATRDELRVVADQHGSPTSAHEIADAILRIAPRLSRGEDDWGTYHFTADGVTTWHGFASRIVEIQAPRTGRNPAVIPIKTADYPAAAVRPANSQLDCQLFARVFGFSARHWTDGVDRATRTLVNVPQRVSHVA
jgi:dTDP-4-dehydrorhamnose reductase